MVTPEDRLKFQIKSQLNMVGGWPEGKPMRELVDAIFEAVFNKQTAASVQQVLIDIREEE